jgi:hypothetical protein
MCSLGNIEVWLRGVLNYTRGVLLTLRCLALSQSRHCHISLQSSMVRLPGYLLGSRGNVQLRSKLKTILRSSPTCASSFHTALFPRPLLAALFSSGPSSAWPRPILWHLSKPHPRQLSVSRKPIAVVQRGACGRQT